MQNLRYGIVGGGFVAAFHLRAFCQVRGIVTVHRSTENKTANES
jgi:ornithine cyclodeaminase/alanine dehydrogenase-like protein (mu-crystallin family)